MKGCTNSRIGEAVVKVRARPIIVLIALAAFASACGRDPTSGVSLARPLGDPYVAPRASQVRSLPTEVPTPAAKVPPLTKPSKKPAAPRVEKEPPPVEVFPAECTAPSGGERSFATEEAMTEHLVGRWQICGHPSIFTTDEDGLELASDHRWYKLDRAADGTFVRRLGWDDQGIWGIPREGQGGYAGYAGGLTFKVDGGGEVYTDPTYATAVPRMHLNSNWVWQADYVKIGPEEPPPQPTEPPADPVAACSAPEGGEDSFESKDAFVERLVGIWQLCAKPSVFGTDEDGLEVTSDNRWFKLYRTADGSLARMTGPKDQGDWYLVDNGPGYWQLNLRFSDGSEVVTGPIFAVDVPKMRLNNNAVFIADYIKL